MPPTVPLSASLYPLPFSDCLFCWQWKKAQLCGVLFGWMRKNQPVVDFSGQSQAVVPGPNRVAPGLLGSSHLHTTGQWGLSCGHITHICFNRLRSGTSGELMLNTAISTLPASLKQKATFPDFLKMNNKQMPFSIELYILLKGTDTNFTKNSSDIRN